MSLRTALTITFLFTLAMVIAWPLLPADEPPATETPALSPQDIEWNDWYATHLSKCAQCRGTDDDLLPALCMEAFTKMQEVLKKYQPQTIEQVPATAGLPPAPTEATRNDPMKEPSVAAGNCDNGVCPTQPTSQPEQRSSGTYRRGLFRRRF